MRILDWLIARTQEVSRITVWCAGAFMLATVVMVGAEVILRRFGSGLVTGASEVGGYMLAICSVWAFTFTLLSRSNIRFDILYARFGPRMRAVADLLGVLAMGAFIFPITYHSYAVLATSISFGARSVSSLSIPLWIPQSVWFAGLVFLCWTIALLAVRVLVALVQQDLDTVSRLAGAVMAEDTVEQEAGDVLDDLNGAPAPLSPER